MPGAEELKNARLVINFNTLFGTYIYSYTLCASCSPMSVVALAVVSSSISPLVRNCGTKAGRAAWQLATLPWLVSRSVPGNAGHQFSKLAFPLEFAL